MLKSRNIVVFGSGGHALAVLDVAASAGFELYAVIDPHQRAERVFGLPVLGSVSHLRAHNVSFCLGVGTNFLRERIYVEAKQESPGAEFPVLRHSSASVSSTATVGEGTVLMASASIGPGCSVGFGSVLNSGSSIDHETELGPFGSLAPGARTGGQAKLGARVMLGMGTVVLQSISIGSDAVIGALSMVNRDVSGLTVAYGNPCREIRVRAKDEDYF